MSRKIQLLEDWYRRVWVMGDADAIDDFFASSTRAAGILPDMQIGPQEFKLLVTMVLELIDNPRVTIEHAVEQGDWIAAMTSLDAIAIANSAEVNCGGMVMVRFEEDKIVEAYNVFDFMKFFESLGQLPENFLALCLTGQRFG